MVLISFQLVISGDKYQSISALFAYSHEVQPHLIPFPLVKNPLKPAKILLLCAMGICKLCIYTQVNGLCSRWAMGFCQLGSALI